MQDIYQQELNRLQLAAALRGAQNGAANPDSGAAGAPPIASPGAKSDTDKDQAAADQESAADKASPIPDALGNYLNPNSPFTPSI